MNARNGQGSLRELLQVPAGKALIGVVAGLSVLIVVALALLWPTEHPKVPESPPVFTAEVLGVEAAPCNDGEGEDACRYLKVRLLEGRDSGDIARLVISGRGENGQVAVDDRIRLAAQGKQGTGDYYMIGFERGMPMLWLFGIFALLAILIGRARGLRSLLGLALSLAVVVYFIIPAIVAGSSPLLVALVGAAAVMFVVVPLTHGYGIKTVAALLSTSVVLLLIIGLAVAAAEMGNLFQVFDPGTFGDQLAGISPTGLVVAGMVIGALGVLDDITVSQASTVLALHRANPDLGARELYRRSVDVGRDHLGALTNTLVLAYVGGALPALLLFSVSGVEFGSAINDSGVAQAITATLVGSIGLMCAVPLTSAATAAMAAKLPAALMPETRHEH